MFHRDHGTKKFSDDPIDRGAEGSIAHRSGGMEEEEMDHRLFSRWGKPTVQRQEQDQRMGDRNRSMSVPPICPIAVGEQFLANNILQWGQKSNVCPGNGSRESGQSHLIASAKSGSKDRTHGWIAHWPICDQQDRKLKFLVQLILPDGSIYN